MILISMNEKLVATNDENSECSEGQLCDSWMQKATPWG